MVVGGLALTALLLSSAGGTCYGGTPPTEGPNPGCCNSCDDVREAYVRRGWSFVNPDSVEQCVSEGWSDKIKEQAAEGCNIAGKVRVNRVIGNLYVPPLLFSPSRSGLRRAGPG